MAGEISLNLDQAALRRVERALAELPTRVFNRVIRVEANKAMTPVVRAAKARCTRRTGLLRKSIGKVVRTYRRSGRVAVIVGPRRGFKDPTTGEDPANIAHLIERGTGPHSISSGASLRKRRGQEAGGMHPGARAKPFMRPAYDEQRHAVVASYTAGVIAGIDREVRAAR